MITVAPLPPMFCAMPRRALGIWLAPGLAAQLLHDLDHLVDTGGADGMPPRLEPAHGADGDAALAA